MLELTAIHTSDPCYSSVLSFLECVIDQAPHLSTLILGPGHIQDQTFNLSSSYKNLRRLELLDVQFLSRINSYRISVCFSIWKPSSSETRAFQHICLLLQSLHSTKSLVLQSFEVDGTFDLIEELLAGITSSDLRALSSLIFLTYIRPMGPTFPARQDAASRLQRMWYVVYTSRTMVNVSFSCSYSDLLDKLSGRPN